MDRGIDVGCIRTSSRFKMDRGIDVGCIRTSSRFK
jgi:hypothetical protein